MFWGLCASGLILFYKHMIWQANEDINGVAATRELYGDARQVAHPIRKDSKTQ